MGLHTYINIYIYMEYVMVHSKIIFYLPQDGCKRTHKAQSPGIATTLRPRYMPHRYKDPLGSWRAEVPVASKVSHDPEDEYLTELFQDGCVQDPGISGLLLRI